MPDSLAYKELDIPSDYCQPDEFEQLVDLAFDYHETAPEFFSKIDPQKMITRLAMAMSRHPAFVLREDGKIVGAVVLDEGIPWWGNERYLTDLFIYVKKEYRSFAGIKNLLEWSKTYAQEMDMRLEMTIFNPEDLGRKEKLFNRMGLSTKAFIVGA